MKRIILSTAIVVMVLVWAQYARADTISDTPKDDRFFCGYCHVLTYPKVIKKAHASWKTGKHKKIPCADCHYPPETRDSEIPGHRRIPKDEREAREKRTEYEYMKVELEVLSRLITLVNLDEATVVRRSKVVDGSCTSSKCHPTTGKGKEGEYWEKKLKFAEYEYEEEDKPKGEVFFTHKAHYDEKKWIKGDVIHCTTCHQRLSEKKHFEVSKEGCYLCHFANSDKIAKLNQDRSKCELCHKIPTEPLQKQKKEGEREEDEPEPITHEKLEKDKVTCESCHLHVFKGKGEIVNQKCLDCHDNDKALMEKADDLKLMHKEHVADQNARCFECHEPIEHKKVDYIDMARQDCKACHPDHHLFQKKLLLGEKKGEIPKTPSLMHSVQTNCFGCHTEEKQHRGEKIIRGSAKKCAACHTEKQEKTVKEWKDKVEEETEVAKELEKEAKETIEKAKGKVPEEKLKEAEEMLKRGLENLNLVVYGGGVHNKKYSIMLLDAAMNNFEDATDLLSEE